MLHYHEQHIRAASCKSFGKSMRAPTSTPRGTSWGIELKIGRINYLRGLTKRVVGKVSNLQPSRGRLGDGVKYTLLGAIYIYFFTDFLLYALRSQGARNRRA